jgi:hypothetical protein
MSSMSSLRKNLAGARGGLTNENKRKDAFAQIDDLGQKLNAVSAFVLQMKKEFNDKADAIARAVSAITTLVGQDKVNEEITRQEIERLESEAAQYQKTLDASIQAGALAVAESATDEGCVVVTSEKDAEGATKHPSKLFVALRDYQPEVKELLQGKKAGDIIALPQGGTLEVLGVYVEATPPVVVTANSVGDAPSAAEAPAEVLQ